MTSAHDRLTVSHETARSIGKVLFGAIGTLFLVSLFTLLPGVDRLIPGTAVSISEFAVAVAAISVAAVLVYTASGLATVVAMSLDSSPDTVETAASITYWLIVLFAVLVAHWGLFPVASTLLEEAVWIYDTVFLMIALGPLVVIAARLYLGLGRIADLFADKVAGTEGY